MVDRAWGGVRIGFGVIWLLAFVYGPAAAQAVDPSGEDLSSLDIEELARIKVTAVTRRPAAVAQASAAVTVISRTDIRRSGAANLPEALRLLPGLAAARTGTRDWAISSRGFNQQSSNKMLVLIDGRVVYSPIFAGVFWDVQRVPLREIDRIELVRGPGAALWGANAVNGVINVVTRTAEESRGGSVSLIAGTNAMAQGELRYGGALGSAGSVRVYGLGSTEGASESVGGGAEVDDWQMAQGGFRADLPSGVNQTFTFQGDLYAAGGGQRLVVPAPTAPFSEALSEDLTAEGANLLGRWQRRFSSRSELAIQGYVDYAARSQPGYFGRIGVTTLEMDLQHHFPLGERQDVIWGLGYRRISDDISGGFTAAFVPPQRTVDLVTGFLQDEIVVLPRRLALNLGSKFEHNDYTGFELQPTARLLWTPSLSTSIWTAVSRAVRTPSRVDADIRLVAQVFDAPPLTQVELRGNNTLDAEELIAYELGYRTTPHERVAFDVSGFYHRYSDVRSFLPGAPESGDGVTVLPYTVTNFARSRVVGGTVSAMFQLTPRWRLRASYTYLDENAELEPNAPAGAIPDLRPELNPRHQAGLWTSLDLPRNVELDLTARYVGRLDVEPEVGDYLQANLRVGLSIREDLRIALSGRDLLSDAHVEFPQPGFVPGRRAIERQFRAYGTWAF